MDFIYSSLQGTYENHRHHLCWSLQMKLLIRNHAVVYRAWHFCDTTYIKMCPNIQGAGPVTLETRTHWVDGSPKIIDTYIDCSLFLFTCCDKVEEIITEELRMKLESNNNLHTLCYNVLHRYWCYSSIRHVDKFLCKYVEVNFFFYKENNSYNWLSENREAFSPSISGKSNYIINNVGIQNFGTRIRIK